MMTEAEAMALLTIAAGILPALSSRGWWIAGLTVAAGIIMTFGVQICAEESEGLAGILCIFALTAGVALGLASLVLGLIRWRYRVRGAETAIGKPWVAGIALYTFAVVVFFGLVFGVVS